MVFIILINIGISVPIYQESDRSCIYVLVVSIVSVFLRFCAVASCDITRVFENIDQYSAPAKLAMSIYYARIKAYLLFT
jgi:hypothetical protein